MGSEVLSLACERTLVKIGVWEEIGRCRRGGAMIGCKWRMIRSHVASDLHLKSERVDTTLCYPMVLLAMTPLRQVRQMRHANIQNPSSTQLSCRPFYIILASVRGFVEIPNHLVCSVPVCAVSSCESAREIGYGEVRAAQQSERRTEALGE